MKKVSWIILTHNRFDMVDDAFRKNLYHVNQKYFELIWVDNGSENNKKAEALHLLSDIKILNQENLGVSRGYNQGMVFATGELILITGCDRIMPENWFERMVDAFDKISNMACVSCYSQEEHKIVDRYPTRKKVEKINGIEFMRALPFEARMFRRSLLTDVGYFHEGFGLYGYEDCHWGPRFLKIAQEKNLICCTLPNFKAYHLGQSDAADYKSFKQKESDEPWKWELVKKLAQEGYPKFNPYL